VLNDDPLRDLVSRLARTLATFGPFDSSMGNVAPLEKAEKEAERVFQGSAKRKPSRDDARAAALALSRGQPLNELQHDIVASALSIPLSERQGACALECANIDALLSSYEAEAKSGDLWRLTWFGLLASYFDFNIAQASSGATAGWQKLRSFLQRTWPLIDRQSASPVVPDWITLVRADPALLSEDATRRYAASYLQGEEAEVQRLSVDLGIPESSWFWHALVLSTVKQASSQSDQAFKASIPRLLALVQKRPVFRDDALELILSRYFKCTDRTIHVLLRDYVVRKDVWKNPKLKAAGIATAWNRVSNDVWMMVLQWVNESNLRDFFEIVASRNNADEGRLEFWSEYLAQITWTRLIFSAETQTLARHSPKVRELIAREDGAYATLTGALNVDAFMMQIGDHIVVEFSVKPNAAYIYESNELQFDRYAGTYQGDSDDLKYGYTEGATARIVHTPGWQPGARQKLQGIGIYPDSDKRARKSVSAPHIAPQRARATPEATPRTTSGGVEIPQFVPEPVKPPPVIAEPFAGNRPNVAPAGAPFTLDQLQQLVQEYRRAFIRDLRIQGGGGGRERTHGGDFHQGASGLDGE